MKTMTCRQLGGPCNEKLSADSWDEMVEVMTEHVMDNHPETAAAMEKMHEKDPKKWGKENRPKWDETPEDGEVDQENERGSGADDGADMNDGMGDEDSEGGNKSNNEKNKQGISEDDDSNDDDNTDQGDKLPKDDRGV